MGDDAAFGRKVKGVKIYAEDTADYVEELLGATGARRAPDDTFSTFVNRAGRRRARAVRSSARDGRELR